MIRVAIAITVHNIDEGEHLHMQGAGASTYMVLEEEDYWSVRYENVLERLMEKARADYNLGEDEESLIPS